jgi:hypothetical protein
MHNKPPQTDADQSGGPQFREAFERLAQIIREGLRHGHFRCTISSGIGKGKRRELVIEAGKSHKFTIPEEDCRAEAAPTAAISAMGTPEMQMTSRSSVIGAIPRPEARSTERRRAGREVFGETITLSKRRSGRPHPPGLAAARRA